MGLGSVARVGGHVFFTNSVQSTRVYKPPDFRGLIHSGTLLKIKVFWKGLFQSKNYVNIFR